MKKWFSKYGWWILISILPIVLMLFLHLGIAISQYVGITFNINGVTAKDWFMFMGNYLGGAVTLIGIVLTIKHTQNVHKHQLVNANIDKENDEIADAISKLNTYESINIYNTFLIIAGKGVLNAYDCLVVNDRINSVKSNINSSKMRIMLSTDIMSDNFNCVTCKNPCGLKKIAPDFAKIYNEVSQTMFDTLGKIDKYRMLLERLVMTNEIISTNLYQLPETIELSDLCNKCSGYMQNEIPQLIALSKSYIFIKRENARKACFENFKGGATNDN